MTTKTDRTVHASVSSEEFAWSCEYVRYDRAGKWYFEEYRNGKEIREMMTVTDLAKHFVAMRRSGKLVVTHYGGRPGGAAFDRAVSKA